MKWLEELKDKQISNQKTFGKDWYETYISRYDFDRLIEIAERALSTHCNECDRLRKRVEELEAEPKNVQYALAMVENRRYRKALEDNLHYLHSLNDKLGPSFVAHNEIVQMIFRATEALKEKGGE